MVTYVLPVRNRVSRFLSRLGKKVCEELYTFDRAVGEVEEPLTIDAGMGFDDPSYQDEVVPMEVKDPVNSDVEDLPSDVIDSLGLGPIKAPGIVVLDKEVDGVCNEEQVMMEEVFEGDERLTDETIFAGYSIPIKCA